MYPGNSACKFMYVMMNVIVLQRPSFTNPLRRDLKTWLRLSLAYENAVLCRQGALCRRVSFTVHKMFWLSERRRWMNESFNISSFFLWFKRILLMPKQVKNLYKWTSVRRWQMEYLQLQFPFIRFITKHSPPPPPPSLSPSPPTPPPPPLTPHPTHTHKAPWTCNVELHVQMLNMIQPLIAMSGGIFPPMCTQSLSYKASDILREP